MKHFSPLLKWALSALFMSSFLWPMAAQNTIAYWNFNVEDFSGNWPQPIAATLGEASIAYIFSQAASFAGTGINGLDNETSGGSFCPQGGAGNENNGRWLVLSLPALTVSEMTLSYATRRTSTGFTSHEVQYTVDGTNWVTHQILDISGYANSWNTSQVEEVIFTGISGMTNNDDFAIRIVLDGVSSASGNTRFDNMLLQTSEGIMQSEARLQTLTIGSVDALALSNIEVADAEAEAGALYEVEDFSLLTGISLVTVSHTATAEVFVNSILVEPGEFADFSWSADDEIVVVVTAEDPQYTRQYKLTLLQQTFPEGFTLAGELYDFKEVVVGNTSDVQFFYLSAGELLNDLVITAPAGFGVSVDCQQGFAAALTIPLSEGGFNDKQVFVKFVPAEVKDYNGSLLIQSGEDEGSLLVSGSGINSNIPDGYYDTATGQKKELMTQLHRIVREHHKLYYSQIWTIIGSADRQFNDKIWDVYSSLPCSEPPYEFEYEVDQDGGADTNTEGVYYNREHSWPSSWWGGGSEDADTMYTDVHHIFPTDKVVNAQRGNNPFGEVGSVQWFSLNGGLLGSNNYGVDYTGTVFEPIDAYKGDLARAWLYFVTRYQHRLINWSDDYMVNLVLGGDDWPAFKPWVLEMLLEWHRNDPVSQKEIIRNDAIWLNQGNRNPYVDHPEFVEQVFTLETSDRTRYSTDIQVFPNPFEELIRVAGPTEGLSIKVCDSMGREVFSASEIGSGISTSGWQSGVYIVLLCKNGQPVKTVKLIK
jgi:endonuclease I